MSKLEQGGNPETPKALDQQIEDIALAIAEMEEAKQIVQAAKSKAGAVRELRLVLTRLAPEISELPEPQPIQEGLARGRKISNDFRIARLVVNLLTKKQ